MKLHLVGNFSEGNTKEQIDAFRQVFDLTTPEVADVVYCGSIDTMGEALKIYNTTGKPMAVYCWDYYKWVHEGGNKNWNWKQYALFLHLADVVIVPSRGQQRRLKELLNIDSFVVQSGIGVYEADITDDGFILDPVRYYPEENERWAELAARELGIPIIHSEHQYSWEEFKNLVASCSFMTCAYREASTGGLTLMEGLWLGKPSLVSNSPYMGAVDYLGEFGTYFQYDDFNDLKDKMSAMWETKQKHDIASTRDYIQSNYTFTGMAERIKKILCEQLKN